MDTILSDCIDCLNRGGVILYPTDTIWGLGCLSDKQEAVNRIFEIKKRPKEKTVILLAKDRFQIGSYLEKKLDSNFDLLFSSSDRPQTVIFSGVTGLPIGIVREDGSCGFRIPNRGWVMNLIKELHVPLVSTSANYSGDQFSGKFEDIPKSLKNSVDYIVAPALGFDEVGSPSRIIKVDLNGKQRILRD